MLFGKIKIHGKQISLCVNIKKKIYASKLTLCRHLSITKEAQYRLLMCKSSVWNLIANRCGRRSFRELRNMTTKRVVQTSIAFGLKKITSAKTTITKFALERRLLNEELESVYTKFIGVN